MVQANATLQHDFPNTRRNSVCPLCAGPAGLARAKAEGKTLGRPKIAEKTERAVRAALSKKERPGLRKIAASLDVGVGTVQRINRELH